MIRHAVLYERIPERFNVAHVCVCSTVAREIMLYYTLLGKLGFNSIQFGFLYILVMLNSRSLKEDCLIDAKYI